jgi:hypothetical protein
MSPLPPGNGERRCRKDDDGKEIEDDRMEGHDNTSKTNQTKLSRQNARHSRESGNPGVIPAPYQVRGKLQSGTRE